jgi:aspartyl-tRNA(Asn)/glutamyl-tRNA(Gln) amidotransferase subunit B
MPYTVQGKTGEWEVVMGLEVHCQVKSKSKLFSRSSTKFGNEQNSNVSFFDAAMPGQLPVINEYAVKQAVKTGLGFNGKINLRSVFDRKNYFYADLPQGYQISQFFYPIVGEGYLEIFNEDNEKRKIGIERLHLEQDAGKLMHDQHPKYSLVDLNRSGIALMEIVSKPDIRSPYEAMEYMRKLRALVRALDTCSGDMEKGSMRCDVNVSVKRVGTAKLGTRCEIKNVNSLKSIGRASEYEIKRQIELIENGGEVEQETRLFNALTGETKTMRSKEDAIDYRYFPDPDLCPLILTQEFVDEVKKEIPELPEEKKARYIGTLGLSKYDAGVLTASKEISSYFEKIIAKHEPKLSANWLTSELFGRLNKMNLNIDESPVSAEMMIELLDLIKDTVISGKIAKTVLDDMLESGKSASKIVEEKGLKQITNVDEIAKIVDKVIADNPKQLEQYKGGNERLFGFFVGQTMKATGGKVNPKVVNEVLKERL